MPLNRLADTGQPIQPPPDVQRTTMALDVLGRFVCNRSLFKPRRINHLVVAAIAELVMYGCLWPELQAAGISDNLDLSAKRAVSVANYLTSHGVKPDLVSVHALGESHPAASNDTAEGRAKNCRVEITLTGDGS